MIIPAPLGPYLRTAAGLRPGQVGTRLRLRGQRAVLRLRPQIGARLLRGDPPASFWPIGFLPFDGRCPPARPTFDELADGRLTLLDHSRDLRRRRPAVSTLAASSAVRRAAIVHADPTVESAHQGWDWQQTDAPLLWRYHLHYWDWAWALATEGERGRTMFARLYLDWHRSVPMGDPVAWSPYVVSLRAWTLCGLWPRLARATPAEDAVLADLGVCRSFLRAHLETDVGGNHLLKNYKALIGLAVADGDGHGRDRWVDALRREIGRQILSDGGHYERSPAYHCQVLADVDDVVGLLTAAAAPVPPELPDATTRMRAWLAAVLGPDGTVPSLNDGFGVRAEEVRFLLPASAAPAPAPAPADGLLLADTGLAVLTAGPWHLLADVGLPCPANLPAHAHADTLAFLLWHDGQPLLVDTGTSTYEAGPRRTAERGTAAHSTVTIDDADSTEVWGAFRAGRRAHPTLVTMSHLGETATLAAGHDGFRHLPGRPTHWRTWRLDPTGLSLEDRISGDGRHRVEVLFHFASGVHVASGGPESAVGSDAVEVTTPRGHRLLLRVAGSGTWRIRTTDRATGWGQIAPAYCAGYVLDSRLPVRVRSELTLCPSHRGSTSAGGPA
ncbi:heparinase II/III family protein [Candidatus Frankia alpina]|uniref:heparinase II/III family protein n=1 Tax=Candidatus Frankia alpina TaxID=2699483 RepID=UPI0013D226D9|nr:heparinase II/III family protein [Candidatus Frankia alpina]